MHEVAGLPGRGAGGWVTGDRGMGEVEIADKEICAKINSCFLHHSFACFHFLYTPFSPLWSASRSGKCPKRILMCSFRNTHTHAGQYHRTTKVPPFFSYPFYLCRNIFSPTVDLDQCLEHERWAVWTSTLNFLQPI